jgi:cell wall-associated NlpC family hydrolase
MVSRRGRAASESRLANIGRDPLEDGRPTAWRKLVIRPLTVGLACTALCVFVARPADAATATTAHSTTHSVRTTSAARSTTTSVTPQVDPAVPAGATPVQASAGTESSGSSSGSSLHLPFAPFPKSLGPMAASIFSREAQVEGLSQQIDGLSSQIATQVAATNTAYAAWQAAVGASNSAANRAADAAAAEYEQSAGLGPLAPYRSDLQQLNLLAPGIIPAPPNAEPDAVNLTTARQKEQAAYGVYTAALTQQENLQTEQSSLQLTFETENADLTQLKAQNAEALAAADAEQNRIDTNLGAQLPISVNVDGQTANPKALQAVAFAMDQLDKPYHFGAEGPKSYDCSGLVWASYRSAGVTVPRIARDQYHGTTPISVDKLLPGDLLFFSTTSNTDWRAITHVGMYVGNGKMIEAPMTGQNVKIAPVWWSAFFGATRVVPAVGAITSPTPTPSPSPTPTPSPSGSPSAPPSTTPPSTTPPSTTPPSTTPPSTTPPTTAPPTSAPPAPTPPPTAPPDTPPPSDEPTPTPSDDPSPSVSPSDTSTAAPSESPSTSASG